MLLRMAKELKRLSGIRNLGTRSQIIYCSKIVRPTKSKQGTRKPCSESGDNGTTDDTDAGCMNKNFAKNPSTNESQDSGPPSAFNPIWQMYKGKKYQKPEHEWEFPKNICCPPCEAFRFDVHYYKPSNLNRNYQRTWWECTPRMVPKRVCCACDAVPPQSERRVRQTPKKVKSKCPGKCQDTACTAGHEKERMDTFVKDAKGCPRFKLPNCRVSRFPPCCTIFPAPSDCVKTKCPFPSYSECIQADPAMIPGRPRECRCLDYIPLCLQLRRANHMRQHNICLYPCSSAEKKNT